MAAADYYQNADRLFARKRLFGFAVPAVILAYLVYVFFAFDILGLAERARMENARVLISDMYSHKVLVTRDNRNGEISYSVEGERKGDYPEGQRPTWVLGEETQTISVDLDGGLVAHFLPGNELRVDVPDFGPVEARMDGRAVVTNLDPNNLPEWVSLSWSRLDVTLPDGRVTFTRNKTEAFNYFIGWELFFFTLSSPYHGHGVFSILFGEQIDPTRSNIAGAWNDFWGNPMWRHSEVAWAIFETLLMAFLGTMGAAIIALPLAFLAAKNFTPLGPIRFAVRRVFDFIRGVDSLIFTIILSRAFGPGVLTGTLAILITDTGTFGKMFSESLENVDKKQIEGIESTGAKTIQRYRFGVIPQVTPIFLSQILFSLESSTRSATIIGAITGGGIGLLLTQAIYTQKDWEEVTYYIILVILLVMLMDQFSGWLRHKLIGKKD
ncbi:MAG: phosphonate ABC transporter, permease protein PhnE [Pseudomonadota bacterium]|uniref:phosphonate ABC transporter, permease protein PhnE n=1 Tax=Thalassococcus sp. TaxID=1928858 RepID=UPI001B2488E0|nr:phosphonate ABC transporter, permease protein PhnE [Thalassococcus sp.]MBO6868775.1 phosphonate ABC transporter, permease protein PhnE [Thalassococcus sp.]MEE2810955.1 phosphonate ABC transporter, permease protein PhnE [Pseudomonadota bacterium]